MSMVLYLVSILILLTSVFVYLYIRQKQKLDSLITQNKSLVQSRDASLEYIEALWKSQQSIIRDEKLSSLNSLVAGVAHELNTPLGVSLTALSYIEDLMKTDIGSHLEEDASPMLKLAMDNLLKSINLVEKFTEISGGDVPEEPSPIEIREFFEFTLTRVKNVSAINILESIKYDFPSKLWINVSQMSLSIVLKNIIENALEYSLKSKSKSEVLISAKDSEGDLIISIKDNGEGISYTNLKSIYDPFYTTHRADKHYGLGLAISYNLLTRQHNGKLNCKSQLGEGTEFIISIPTAICSEPLKINVND